jgi:death-on-curing protein
MDRILPELRQHYDTWRRRTQEYGHDPIAVITPDDVLRAHYLLADYFIREGEQFATAGPRCVDLLFSAVGRQTTGYNGSLKWKQGLDQCATLFFGLIKNHPFHDGNKRTALLVALYHLHCLKRIPCARQKEFETLAVRTADGSLEKYKAYADCSRKDDPEVRFISQFLKSNARKQDTQLRMVTYLDLDRILRKHGYWLGNPAGNHIDILTTEEQRHGPFGLRRRSVEQKVLQVGFPRWTAQVGASAIKCVLRATGLTPENGYDARVIFDDAEPMSVLIDRYRGPFTRLKDR